MDQSLKSPGLPPWTTPSIAMFDAVARPSPRRPSTSASTG